MLELLFAAMVTVVPDYLYRYYVQGKRIGREITIFSVWYELRYGITACAMITITLITLVFYYHPSTTNVSSLFRTVPILPETGGRVAEIFAGLGDSVEAGQPIFRLDSAAQQATVARAEAQVSEVEAAISLALTDIPAAQGKLTEARGALQQATDELAAKTELNALNADVVTKREIERLQIAVDSRQGAVAAAQANLQAAETQVSQVLPARMASAKASLVEAQVALDQTVIRAGIAGTLEQFALRPGDFVSPLMRPAGVLTPAGAGQTALAAGFNQIEAQVITVGMAVEAVCASKPFTIIPMVVTHVQDSIASGQVQLQGQLLDAQQIGQPGTLLVYLEPLFQGGLDGVPAGSSCSAYAYTNNHDRLASEDLGLLHRTYLHVVDTVAVVHAVVVRINVLLFPIRSLVFSGGH